MYVNTLCIKQSGMFTMYHCTDAQCCYNLTLYIYKKMLAVCVALNMAHKTWLPSEQLFTCLVHTTVGGSINFSDRKNNVACCAIFSVKTTDTMTETQLTHYSQCGLSGAICVHH